MFKIVCYHYKRMGKNNRKKVVTHRAEQKFNFSMWTDTSPESQSLSFINNLKIVRMKFYVQYKFSPQAKSRYATEGNVFYSINKRDQEQSFTKIKQVKGFKKSFLAFTNEENKKPWYCSSFNLFLLSLLTIAQVQRITFLRNSTKVTYNFEKYIIQ